MICAVIGKSWKKRDSVNISLKNKSYFIIIKDPVIEYNKAIEGFEMHYHPEPEDIFKIIL